jgi:hypothetical protein
MPTPQMAATAVLFCFCVIPHMIRSRYHASMGKIMSRIVVTNPARESLAADLAGPQMGLSGPTSNPSAGRPGC